MQKVAVIYRDPSRPATGVAAQLQHLREFVAPHCHALTLHVRSRALSAEIIAAGGLDATLAAALMLWVEKPEVVEALDYPLAWLGSNRQTYFLVESTLREYPRIDWPESAMSPGVTLLALLSRRRTLSMREFHEHWQQHSKLSLQLHPLTRYHRNAVLRQAGHDTPDCDGIVEERIASLADLAPERFYIGDGARERATRSLDRYVDLSAGGLSCALMDEYLIKLPAWLLSTAQRSAAES